jgi:threonine dehydrogenase-like Zn-dependent dehydrogenase
MKMKTKAVRIYGKDDLRLEEFELPEMKEDEILAEVISDSICMSSYKATKQGPDHKRIPDDIHVNPTIIGHEFSGIIKAVGKKWKKKFSPGEKFSIQPALNYKGSLNAPGYSYRWIGGDATHILIPSEVMEMDCLLPYYGKEFFLASLSEPMSCVIGAFHASYHTRYGSYVHEMGIKEGGNLALLAGVGPMGLAAIDYVLNCDRKPKLLVVTDIDQNRINRASKLHSPEKARKQGIDLKYLDTSGPGNALKEIMSLSAGKGFDDVFVFAPVRQVVEQADKILAFDGCLNFFAGPANPEFSAELNFYNVHYSFTHIVGTSGGNTSDMNEALQMMAAGKINPAGMITHIGGLDSVIETTKNLPNIPGGKKLIYTHKQFPLVSLEDLMSQSVTYPFMAGLNRLVKENDGLWSYEAEKFLLENAPDI